jgi:hypothetical protein
METKFRAAVRAATACLLGTLHIYFCCELTFYGATGDADDAGRQAVVRPSRSREQ